MAIDHNTILFIAWIAVWFPLWFIVAYWHLKQWKEISIVAFLLITLWFGFHIYGFIYDKSMPYMVDILGGASIWQILGLKAEKLLALIPRKWS